MSIVRTSWTLSARIPSSKACLSGEGVAVTRYESVNFTKCAQIEVLSLIWGLENFSLDCISCGKFGTTCFGRTFCLDKVNQVCKSLDNCFARAVKCISSSAYNRPFLCRSSCNGRCELTVGIYGVQKFLCFFCIHTHYYGVACFFFLFLFLF